MIIPQILSRTPCELVSHHSLFADTRSCFISIQRCRNRLRSRCSWAISHTVNTTSQSMNTETHSYIGLTEEQIKDIFGSAGKVMSFRLVYDRETGRPKGFGFVEFPDSGSLSIYHFCAQKRNSTSLLTLARLYRFCCIRCTKSERV